MTIYEDVQKKRLFEMLAMIRLFSRVMEKRSVHEIVDYVLHRMDNDQTYTVTVKFLLDLLSKNSLLI